MAEALNPAEWGATPVDGPASWGAQPMEATSAEPADHGLSERQKLSPVGKALSPITSYPETYQRMNQDARDQVSHGIDQISNAEGVWDAAKGAGNVALGTVGYVASPINAAYRSVVGQPVEDVTGIPREYTEFAAQLATPGLGLPGAVKAPAPNLPRPAPVAPPSEIVDAARRVSEVAPEPVNVPRAFASDNIAVQRTAQGIRNLPVVGDAIPRATGEMVDQLGNSVRTIADEYGAGSGSNVANRIRNTIAGKGEAETAAARGAAQRSDDALLADYQRNIDAAGRDIATREATALQNARSAVGDMSPQDMGETLISRLRTGEQEARANKDRLYGAAGRSDAAVSADAVGNVRARVAQSLDDDGRVIDGVLTPASARMMEELQRFSGLNIENRAVGARPPVPGGEQPTRVAVSVQGIEQTRKRLNAIAQSATNDADRSAARRIIREFDNWESDSFDNALFSGSPEALDTYRRARDANRDWRTRFGYNQRDDADRIVNRIVTGEVTPQEVSNWLVGASQVGAKGQSSRLLTRIAEATGNDPEALQAIRGGVWNRLSQATEGATAKAPEKVASGINEFLNGSGRDVARRLFTPEQQGIMRAYADTLRVGGTAREIVADVARTTKPQAMEVGTGPLQELANTVLGRGGQRSDEALYSAIDAYAKSGSRGDVRTLANLVRNIPERDKGDLAGAIIRQLGQSKQTNGFSLDLFASEWGQYTPQAKAILFGNAGPYRQALDDIATISQRYKDIGKRFGNPSGTAQNANLFAAAGWVLASPYTAIPSLLGGNVAARMLASPAGASSLSKWGRAYTVAQSSPTPQRLIAFQLASRNLANTASGYGANISPADLFRSLQGSVTSRAQDEQP